MIYLRVSFSNLNNFDFSEASQTASST